MARRPGPDGRTPKISIKHMVELTRQSIPPVHPDGIPFVLAPLASGLIAGITHHKWLRNICLGLAAACAAFFRVPKRIGPSSLNAITAPADGEICIVDEACPPEELGLGNELLPRITIFLSVLDVHVQRAPITGRVISVMHKPGEFLSADKSDASKVNERTSMIQETRDGQQVITVQIAGLIARRILNHMKPGDELDRGTTYGLVRFGSRVDIYLPAGTQPQVWLGQRAIGGETILATLPSRAPITEVED